MKSNFLSSERKPHQEEKLSHKVMRMGRTRFLLVLMCVSAGLWIAFAKLVVPPLIESAYRHGSLPFINNMIKGQHENSLSYYLQKWDQLTIDYLIIGLEIWLLILVINSSTFFRMFRSFAGEATARSLRDGLAQSSEVVRHIPQLPLAPGRYVFNPFSMLALALICAPLTIGAIWAFPLYDDAWVWLFLKEQGAAMMATAVADRPVKGILWSLLAASEQVFWWASFVAQALLWPTLGVISALLWTHLFPNLQRYAMAVGCLTVAPIITRVQMVTASIAVESLLSVVLSYGALVLLLRFVMAGSRFGWVVLGSSVAVLGLAILLTEYALPVAMVMVVLFWCYARRARDLETRVRAWRAIVFSTLTTGVAYAIFSILADYTVRPGWQEISPLYIFSVAGGNLAPFPVRLVEGIWQSVVGGLIISMGAVTLTSISGSMAVAYGALVAGLLFYGSRNLQQNAKSPSRETITKQDVLLAILALVAGLSPIVAMARIPWDPGDGMSSRFGIPLLPIAAALLVLTGLSLVRRRLWAVPIIILGFVAGNATFTEVWSAIQERQQMSALGAALQSHVSSKDGITVAAVSLPERSLGPQRPYELTVRLAATWPPELRRKFWAFRFGGSPPKYAVFYFYDAERFFGSRGDCTFPREFKWSLRHVTRDGPLDQLIWVKPQTDGSISVEPYCIKRSD